MFNSEFFIQTPPPHFQPGLFRSIKPNEDHSLVSIWVLINAQFISAPIIHTSHMTLTMGHLGKKMKTDFTMSSMKLLAGHKRKVQCFQAFWAHCDYQFKLYICLFGRSDTPARMKRTMWNSMSLFHFYPFSFDQGWQTVPVKAQIVIMQGL